MVKAALRDQRGTVIEGGCKIEKKKKETEKEPKLT